MNILRRAALPLFLVLMICAVSVYFYADNQTAVTVLSQSKPQKTVIIDAGHGGLTNTIMAILFETVQPHCFGAKS